MNRKLLPFFLCVFLNSMAFASGPPEDMGHLQISVEGQEVLFDLQVPARTVYSLGLPRGKVFRFGRIEDQAAALPVFQNSLGNSNLQAGGEVCEWQPFEVVLAVGIARIRAKAECLKSITDLSFEFPFLKQEASEFRIAATSNLLGSESFDIRPNNWKVRLGSSFPWGAVIIGFVAALMVAGAITIFRRRKRS